MTTKSTNNPDRIDELMVDAATQGLSPQDEAELSVALERDPALRSEAEAYELAVTAIDLALSKPGAIEPLPAGLREKLIASAAEHLPRPAAQPDLRLSGTPAASPARPDPMKPRFSWTDGRAFGWYAAAIALLAFVLSISTPGPSTSTPQGKPPTLAEQYQTLVKSPETIAAPWGFNAEGGDARFANARGEVIWDSDKQAGYMKLAGLPVNDPTKEQYQLWIVDPTRDAEPIDGGVFDITSAGEVIVPIDAKLRSDSPAVFAITVEQPGGVVVSEGPLQVIAAVPAAG